MKQWGIVYWDSTLVESDICGKRSKNPVIYFAMKNQSLFDRYNAQAFFQKDNFAMQLNTAHSWKDCPR